MDEQQPLQDRPIYAFTLGPDGEVLTKAYHRYNMHHTSYVFLPVFSLFTRA